MSWILHLETSTKVCSVALSENGTLRFIREIADDQYAHGEQLTLLIEAVLNDAGISPKGLAAVSIASGPGSYTGLRIGVSTAKGMCYALNIPLIAIDALSAMAYAALEKHAGKTLCPMIDARRMEVYATIFDTSESGLLTVTKPLSADVLDDSSYSQYEPFVVFGDGAAKVELLWKDRAITFDHALRCTAAGQVKPAFEKFLRKEFEDVAYFEPLYLKEFQAGVKKTS